MTNWSKITHSFKKNKNKYTKKDAERLHARKRASERYGIELNSKLRSNAVDQIQKGTAQFLCRESHRVTVWNVSINDILARVVYDSQRHEIITFLPQ